MYIYVNIIHHLSYKHYCKTHQFEAQNIDDGKSEDKRVHHRL